MQIRGFATQATNLFPPVLSFIPMTFDIGLQALLALVQAHRGTVLALG
jgi:hypothetical protein